jgi:predicted RNase H-like HicB family nuclease
VKEIADDITQVMLDDLAPSSLTLIRPIPVTVELDEESFLVSFVEANVNAGGETLPEALDMLKEMIAFDYQFFGENETDLGSGPRNQLAVLRRYVRS